MPRHLQVAPEDLLVSGAMVDAHADEMRSAHGVSDGRVEAAQKGLPRGSGLAMTAALAKWQAESGSLYTALTQHGQALRAGAATYEQTDNQGAGRLLSAGYQIADIDLGL